MEQWRPTFEDGDDMKNRKQLASGIGGAAIGPSNFDSMMRPPFRSERPNNVAIPDLSVDVKAAAQLRRSRWRSVIQVMAPEGVTVEDEERFVSTIEARLQGREPLTSIHEDTIVTSFSLSSANDEARELVAQFADAMSQLEQIDQDRPEVLVATIAFIDVSDFEDLLPEDRRAEAYLGGS